MADFSVCYEFKRKINKIGLMYKVSKNIKILSFSLMIIGALGLAFSFYSAPKTIEQAKEMVESMDLVDALFISKSGNMTATDGFSLI